MVCLKIAETARSWQNGVDSKELEYVSLERP